MSDFNYTTTQSDYSSYYDTNETDSLCENFDLRSFSRSFLVTLYSLVFILGSLGNGLVVCVLVKHRNQTNLTDICLLNLALSDLLFILTLPFYTHYTMMAKWTFGDFMCRILSWFHHSGFFSSIFFMVAMTLDRYVVIMHAHKVAPYRTLKTGLIMIVFVWILSFCVSLPSLIFSKVPNYEEICLFDPEEDSWKKYDLFGTLVMGLVLPLVVMLVCYSRIIPTLVNMRTTKRYRIVKLIVVIVAVFFCFWAPYHISRFLKFMLEQDVMEVTCTREFNIKMSLTVTEAIAYTHCCLNPIIYAFVGQKFMRRALQLLKKWVPGRAMSWTESSFRRSSVLSKSSDVTSTVIM